jgi:hypothetical protein
MTTASLSPYPPAVLDAIERGRAARAEQADADRRELAGRRTRFLGCLLRALAELPDGIGDWLKAPGMTTSVTLAGRRCRAEFRRGFPRGLCFEADLTADGCEAVGWRVWHVSMREPESFPVWDYAGARAAAAEPVG